MLDDGLCLLGATIDLQHNNMHTEQAGIPSKACGRANQSHSVSVCVLVHQQA